MLSKESIYFFSSDLSTYVDNWTLSRRGNRFQSDIATLKFKLDIPLRPYPCIHEHEVQLAEAEDHLQYRVDTPEHLVARGVPRDLKERTELHSVVHHRAETEGWKGRAVPVL